MFGVLHSLCATCSTCVGKKQHSQPPASSRSSSSSDSGSSSSSNGGLDSRRDPTPAWSSTAGSGTSSTGCDSSRCEDERTPWQPRATTTPKEGARGEEGALNLLIAIYGRNC